MLFIKSFQPRFQNGIAPEKYYFYLKSMAIGVFFVSFVFHFSLTLIFLFCPFTYTRGVISIASMHEREPVTEVKINTSLILKPLFQLILFLIISFLCV